MEFLAVFIGLGLLALAGIGTLLGWIAYARMGRLTRRVDDLERAMVRENRAASPAAAHMTPSATDSRPRTDSAPITPPIAPSERIAPPVRTAPPAEPARTPPTGTPTVPPIPSVASAAEPAIPPAATRSAAAPKPEAERTAKSFDLERWLGVRGAAVLGGIFLAIAAFLFLQHSIERGWITPKARVITATLAGLACFVASSRLRRREYTITANALAGAGAVILYAAAWASSMLYGFVAPLMSFAAMGAVTAACIWVSWKHATQVVAVLGLVGGFATPLVLSTGQDRPFGLFGYVLLLDLAFLFLAGRRRWPAIGLVALAGTTLIQGLWIFVKMDPHEAWIGLGVLGLFAITFASFATTRATGERKSWIPAQTGAVLLPFAFVLYFAQSLALAVPLGAMALLAALLCTAAGVLARRDEARWLPIGAATGSAALLFTWTAARPEVFDASTSWLVASCALAIAALQHAFAEWRRSDGTRAPGAIGGAAASVISALALAIWAAVEPGALQPWPWIATFAAGALLLQRQAALSGRFELAWIGAIAAGGGLAVQRVASLGAAQLGRDAPIFVALVAIGAALLYAAHLRRTETDIRASGRRGAFAAAATYFALVMFAAWWPDVSFGTFETERVLGLAIVLVLGLGALAASTGARSSVHFVATVVIAFLVESAHVGDLFAIAASSSWLAVVALLAVTTAAFAVWPLLTRPCWRNSTAVWCAAPIQALAFAFPIGALVDARFPDTFRFATPLAFAVGMAWFVRLAWRSTEESDPPAQVVQRRARIAATATALLFASAILPVHFDREPTALTLAVFGGALAFLSRRVPSRTVRWVGVAAIVVALLRLAVFSEPWSFDAPARPIANWNAWIYLIPAAAAVYAAAVWRAAPDATRSRNATLDSGIAGIAAVVLVFVWINVEIAARFAIGPRVGLNLPHGEGRALATSIGWAVYALVLLAIGVTRRSSGPRWASLLLFLTTIGKVFLFDLDHLEGLQRVASMLGLALSLIVVSLVYQRFVFRSLVAPSIEPPSIESPPIDPPPNPAPAP